MKTLFTRLLCLLALSSALLVNAAPNEEAAKEPAKAAPEKKTKPKDTYPLWGEVVAVTSRTLTIKGGEGKQDRKFTIGAETKIHNDGKPATLEDIKVGRKVGGSVQKVADGNPKLLSINVGAAQEAAKPKKPAAKAEDAEKAKSDKK